MKTKKVADHCQLCNKDIHIGEEHASLAYVIETLVNHSVSEIISSDVADYYTILVMCIDCAKQHPREKVDGILSAIL